MNQEERKAYYKKYNALRPKKPKKEKFMGTRDPRPSFWKRTNKTDKCWVWIGLKNRQGYGKASFGGKSITAHRLSYIIHFGLIPSGMFVCHHCDNPSCVNPKHLFIGTAQDNNDDMCKKGRNKSVRGSDVGNSKLTEIQVLEIRRLWRNISAPILALRFNVSESHIYRIVNRELWEHI